MLPSPDKLTLNPDKSSAVSPSISLPICVHVPFKFSYILTWPDKAPLPSLPPAPMATILPSLDKLTLLPD